MCRPGPLRWPRFEKSDPTRKKDMELVDHTAAQRAPLAARGVRRIGVEGRVHT